MSPANHLPTSDHGGSLDLAGIGIGPFNLSLAAQLDSTPTLHARFFERRPCFEWHPGMMLPDVELQSSFLKDLVTSTNPTSRWSFVAYLVAHKRLFTFLNARYDAVPRREFARYFEWVADSLANLTFGTDIREISHDGRDFVLTTNGGRHRARNIALGVGASPSLPTWALSLQGDRCFHCSEAVDRLPHITSDRIVVIGGGQSGGEIVQHLLSRDQLPNSLKWISRRHNFEPMNDTPFSNQVFSPEYIDAFRQLNDERKHAALGTHILTSDGLSLSTINAIYRRLYTLRHIEARNPDVELLPNRDVIQVDRVQDGFRLIIRNGFDGGIEICFADVLVLATGYKFKLPDAIAPLQDRIALDRNHRLVLADDYSATWDGPRENRIFALNAGRYSHGIADSQLSLMAWRSAVIVNALLGRNHFELGLPQPVVRWGSAFRHSSEAMSL
ncbi:SidA/IucD/PvdA family monooxygenase [Bradyrhizobium sp. CCGUVB1N3]|uniref:lysine N(6)-hydroxylase/L-ornithine N(5)-oxygenase family protein n=1 Tax=Bradyrhizobium sp. CCGUVB1N3 TaxID=2949629 RepID=UPI0020B249E0|nr:SidA/IucD/PvdA family monooxygenase [Bradyrhizobium sp. CCGUVB1N3]MCP3469090.1 SidA/IucD/PvdA family monooxygenase [Bradyrhizobium sp. CCGUVB1N3]